MANTASAIARWGALLAEEPPARALLTAFDAHAARLPHVHKPQVRCFEGGVDDCRCKGLADRCLQCHSLMAASLYPRLLIHNRRRWLC